MREMLLGHTNDGGDIKKLCHTVFFTVKIKILKDSILAKTDSKYKRDSSPSSLVLYLALCFYSLSKWVARLVYKYQLIDSAV